MTAARATSGPTSWRELVFQLRNYLAALPLFYALFSTRWEWEHTWSLWSMTIVLASSGVALRAWANRHCNYRTRAGNFLATTGPYAYLRNPLYVGTVLILVGANVASGIVWLLPVTITWAFLIYNAVVQREEIRMREKYGAHFLAYCETVPRWFPRLSRFSPHRGSVAVLLRECAAALILIPFVLKELNLFGLWH